LRGLGRRDLLLDFGVEVYNRIDRLSLGLFREPQARAIRADAVGKLDLDALAKVQLDYSVQILQARSPR